MVVRSKILESLTRVRLLEVARTFGIEGVSTKAKREVVEAICHSEAVRTEDLLTLLSRDELKTVCSFLGLEVSGKEKQTLMDRILGQNQSAGPDDADEVPKAIESQERESPAKKSKLTSSGGRNQNGKTDEIGKNGGEGVPSLESWLW